MPAVFDFYLRVVHDPITSMFVCVIFRDDKYAHSIQQTDTNEKIGHLVQRTYDEYIAMSK